MGINGYLESREVAGEHAEAYAEAYGFLPSDWTEAEAYGVRFLGESDFPVYDDAADADAAALLAAWDLWIEDAGR